jgi:hypothetical protein
MVIGSSATLDIRILNGADQNELVRTVRLPAIWTMASTLAPALCVLLIGVIAATVVVEYRRWDGYRKQSAALRKLLSRE